MSGNLQETAMLIDIFQAYADAMYVATMQRPAPTPARQCRRLPTPDETARPAPVVWRRMVRWIALRFRRPAVPLAGRRGSGAAFAAASSGVAVPKI